MENSKQSAQHTPVGVEIDGDHRLTVGRATTENSAILRGIERNKAMRAALRELVALIDAGQSPDYAALQEHRVMRNARAAIDKATGGTS